jgi:hypothetical protein
MSTKFRYIFGIVTVVLLTLVVSGIVYLVGNSSAQDSGLATSTKDDSQALVASTPHPGSDTELTFLTLDTPSSLKLVVEEPSLAIQGSIRQDALLTVGNDIVEPNLEGRFNHTVRLKPGHNLVEILASTSSGEKNSLILAVIYSP